MLSHSTSSGRLMTDRYRPEYPDRSMVSKPSTVPELIQVVARTSSTRTSTVRTLVAPLYKAGGSIYSEGLGADTVRGLGFEILAIVSFSPYSWSTLLSCRERWQLSGFRTKRRIARPRFYGRIPPREGAQEYSRENPTLVGHHCSRIDGLVATIPGWGWTVQNGNINNLPRRSSERLRVSPRS